MSSGISSSPQPDTEKQATPSGTTNGDCNANTSGHRAASKWLSADEHNGQTSARDVVSSNVASGPTRDADSTEKKSLSFFPDESESSDEQSINGSEQNNNSKGEQNSSAPDLTQQKEVISEQKTAVPLESDLEDSSSTSSCSCEEHSSETGRKSVEDENPHGDLDYDDDSITNSPPRNNKSTDPTAAISDESKDGMSNEVDGSESKRIIPDEQSTCAETNPDKASGQTGTKIRSFIGADRGAKNDKRRDADGATKKQLKDRSHKSYEGLLKYFFKDTCYFQIKSINHENIQISKSMGVWSTPMQNEVRLNLAFREHKNVILIFSVQRSGAFQGFARIVSESRPSANPVPWVLPPRLSSAALGGVFQVQWLCTKELDFSQTRDLYNIFNDNKPIKVARDGQEVEPKVGRKLCSLFPRDSKKRLLSSVDTLKAQTKHRKEFAQTQNGFYPMDDLRTHGVVAHNRRAMNGFHDPASMSNGYGHAYGPPSSLGPVYSYPPQHDQFRGRPAVRHRPYMNPHSRRNAASNLGQNLYSGPAHYNHPMMNYPGSIPASSGPYPTAAHNGYYPEPFGPEYPPYSGPQAAYHSRPHQDYNMSPNRYHPYQRARR